MYQSAPDEAELSAFGLSLEDVMDSGVTEIWPENLLPFNVFSALGSQWFVGPGGPTGLRYEVLPGMFDILGIPKKKRRDVFECLRVMEREALKQMNTKD